MTVLDPGASIAEAVMSGQLIFLMQEASKPTEVEWMFVEDVIRKGDQVRLVGHRHPAEESIVFDLHRLDVVTVVGTYDRTEEEPSDG